MADTAGFTRIFIHPDRTAINEHRDQVTMNFRPLENEGQVYAKLEIDGVIHTSVTNHTEIEKVVYEFQRCVGELVLRRARI